MTGTTGGSHAGFLGGRRLAVPGCDFQDVEIRRFLIHPLRNRWAERGTDETGGSAMVAPLRLPFRIASSDRWKWSGSTPMSHYVP